MERRTSRRRWGQKSLRVVMGVIVLGFAVWVGPGLDLDVVAAFAAVVALLLLAALAIRAYRRHAEAKVYERPRSRLESLPRGSLPPVELLQPRHHRRLQDHASGHDDPPSTPARQRRTASPAHSGRAAPFLHRAPRRVQDTLPDRVKLRAVRWGSRS